jgi:hypothetical protein
MRDDQRLRPRLAGLAEAVAPPELPGRVCVLRGDQCDRVYWYPGNYGSAKDS